MFGRGFTCVGEGYSSNLISATPCTSENVVLGIFHSELPLLKDLRIYTRTDTHTTLARQTNQELNHISIRILSLLAAQTDDGHGETNPETEFEFVNFNERGRSEPLKRSESRA